MDIEKVQFDKAGEVLCTYEQQRTESFCDTEAGYSKKYAAFAANYGSIDNEFIIPGEKM